MGRVDTMTAEVTPNGGVAQELAFQDFDYAPSGNVDSVASRVLDLPGHTISFGYDRRDQLVSASGDFGYAATFGT